MAYIVGFMVLLGAFVLYSLTAHVTSWLKYPLALSSCFALFLIYALIGGIMEWKHGGGLIPMLILIAAMVGTWRTITKKPQTNE